MYREKPQEPQIRVLPETGGAEGPDKVWGPDTCPGEDQWAAGSIGAPRTEGTVALGRRGRGCVCVCVREDLWAGIAQMEVSLFFLLINLFLAALGLHCCARAFSSCGEWELLFIVVHRLLIVVASLVAEHGL